MKKFKKDVIVCAKFVPAIGVGGSNAVAVLVGKMGESSKFYGCGKKILAKRGRMAPARCRLRT